jgi:hypothetical protein
MTNEMVERVAKAIFDAEFDFLGIESPWPDADRVYAIAAMRTPEDFRAIARAAIEAMREPTPSMAEAGKRAQIEVESSPFDIGVPIHKTLIERGVAFWRGAIDEALK